MARSKPPVDLGAALVESFRTNDRINRFLLDNVPEAAWRAEPPTRKGRTIAAIAAHIHNVRHMWLVVSAREIKAPAKLDRDKVTKKQAIAALEKSGEAVAELLRRAIAAGGHVKNFRPDVAGFVGYLTAHEAHHRGQICMLARQVGHTLPPKVGFGMWEWGKR